MARIRSTEELIEAIGDAIEDGLLSGVLGIDDEGKGHDGSRRLVILLNDDNETRIPIVLGPATTATMATLPTAATMDRQKMS